MYQPLHQPREEHDLMVRYLVNLFIQRGYTIIGADLPNYLKPEVVYNQILKQGVIPDVLAQKGDQYLFGEAETTSSLLTEHTKSQISTFTSFSNASLVLCIPLSATSKIPLSYKSFKTEIVYYPSLVPWIPPPIKKQMW